MSLYVTGGGLTHANPNAASTNFVKLQLCESSDESGLGLDYFEGAQTGTDTMVSVTIDGVVYPLTTTTLLSDTATWAAEIEQILLTDETKQEINVIVRAAYDGTDLSFEHQGDFTISTITTSGGAIALTRETTKAAFSDKVLEVVGTVDDLNDGVTFSALANNPYAFSGTVATDDATAVQLQADVETALTAIGASFVSVEVTVNRTDGTYKVKVHRQKDGKILRFGATKLTEANPCVEWVNGAVNV